MSVVIATYNRSNVLRLAIESVLAQSLEDWELVVVGDACTDDTASVVASLGDERIRFVTMGRNFGEQSGPNNVGALLSRSELIAYLNHDDLYFPDHLERTIDALARRQADLVFGRLAMIRPWPPDEEPPAAVNIGGEPWRVELRGVDREGPWRLTHYQPASSWVCRRSVVERLGGWRPASMLFAEPSQDFLFRARRARFALVGLPEVTAIAFPTGSRPGVYSQRVEAENREFLDLMRESPEGLRAALARAAAAQPRSASGWEERARQWRSEVVFRLAAALGVNAKELRHRLRGRARGEQIATLRRIRGLDP